MPKIVKDADVFRAVTQVILERGYAGATTKQMAKAAGVSEVTLFRRYGSKAELVRQAISELAIQTGFESAVYYSGDLAADLCRIVAKYRDSAARFGRLFAVLFSDLQRYPELVDSLAVPIGIFGSIGQLVERYQANGELRQEHPHHAVAALLGPLIFAVMMQSVVRDEFYPPLDLQAYVSRYLEGRHPQR